MADALVNFFLQRLDSILLQEPETFSGLEDQILWLMSILNEIGWLFGDIRRRTGGDDAVHSWVRELRDIVHDMDDCIDEFIIQMYNQNGSSRTASTAHFESELEKINARLAEFIDSMSKFDNLTAAEERRKEDMESSYKVDEGETSSPSSHSLNFASLAYYLGSCLRYCCNFSGKERREEENESSSKADEGEASCSFNFRLNYRNLPYYLRSCLMYCCIFPEKYWIPKGRLIRLLVAEGLVQEIPGVIMEDIAEQNIEKLVSLGMLQIVEQHPGNGTKFSFPSSCREFTICVMEEEDFITAFTSSDSDIPPTARRVSIHSNSKNIPPNLNTLPIRSLFMFTIKDLSEVGWESLKLVFYGVKLLRVLDLEETNIKCLPDEIGDLIHLRYLGLKKTGLTELPESLSNLRNLQTLDIRWCGKLTALPSGILKIPGLRHLKMFKNIGVCGLKVPSGIGRMKNLQTFTGLHAGDGIAGELGSLIQLRRLGVMDVAENVASELCASIMKMESLLSLSLQAKSSFPVRTLPPLEPFSPPPLIRKLCLEGGLGKIPKWLGLMGSLTNLRLGFSHLSENPALVLQLLPNLKNLSLWQAHDAKQIGKEFCGVGGFPKLEILSIASHVLEEWTELEEGALPSLKYLHFHNCLKLRMLPEGLQSVTTLQQLDLLPLLNDHAERLKPDGGGDNYKIKHIPIVRFHIVEQLMNQRIREEIG
ncbi:hypothetical protein HHK36_029583 [Tetracentron sinense]|uniref:Rx N-terminal domain-containing protein n=1 Tax=Tetracentron sinense TaxID=13715 RepID=A0A834YBJ5_TETSI|nr:hypothetical protein HHK36_029583 [Tetracentron sinense]